VINISGMSFGSLSGNAVAALNRGAALAECLQNTGEGSISPYHRQGGELVYRIGTGYFGCRSFGSGAGRPPRAERGVDASWPDRSRAWPVRPRPAQ
jgi:glutamate synthase domain-containing protein 2